MAHRPLGRRVASEVIGPFLWLGVRLTQVEWDGSRPTVKKIASADHVTPEPPAPARDMESKWRPSQIDQIGRPIAIAKIPIAIVPRNG